mmetsp:Transcript_4902/g.11307  ORF Transcript_4902/g.11307 Transcript_4902/m.11307 type:complete len:265 (-) Transcript_4902:10-804(-)
MASPMKSPGSKNVSLNLSINTNNNSVNTSRDDAEEMLLSTSDKRAMRTSRILNQEKDLIQTKAIVTQLEGMVLEDEEADREFRRSTSENILPRRRTGIGEGVSRRGHTKRELLRRLVESAPVGNPKALMVCVEMLKDADGSVRRAAIEALEEVIDLRNLTDFECRSDIVHGVGRACMDWSAQVRVQATKLLKLLGNKADGDAPERVLHHMRIESNTLPQYAKLAAVESVVEVATRGDKRTIGRLLEELEDKLPDLRLSVVVALK